MKDFKDFITEGSSALKFDAVWDDIKRGTKTPFQPSPWFGAPVELVKMGDMDMQVWYHGRQIGIISRYSKNVNNFQIGGPRFKNTKFSNLNQAVMTILKSNHAVQY
jgi:hypothetical protein